MNHRLTNLVGLGRATAVKVNLGKAGPDFLTADQPEKSGRPGENLRVLRGCAAWFKNAPFSASTSVKRSSLKGLSFKRTSALLGALVLLAILPTIAHAEGCPNEVFRAGPSAHLPECRAYELVSPPEKNGGYISQGSFSGSPGGETVGFTSISGFAGATSDLNAATGYQSSRSSTGWNTRAETQSEAQFIDLHGALGTDFLAESFGNLETSAASGSSTCGADCNLESGERLWRLQDVSQPESDLSFYRTGADGANIKIGPAVPETAANLIDGEEISVLGWSADTSHMVFEDPESTGPNQWPFSAPGALLEYAGTGNTTPMLVGVDDSGHFVNGCSRQQLGGTTKFHKVVNPISSDGSRVFFTDECQGELFARVNNGRPQSPVNAVGTCTNPVDACTVPISDPSTGPEGECSACNTGVGVQQPAGFLGASEDGSEVFFDTTQPLLDGHGGLYEYDFNSPEGEKLTLIAPGLLIPMGIQGLGVPIVMSQDGSHIYFLSEEVLTDESSPNVQGANGEGDPVRNGAVAQPSMKNLYVFERDSRYPDGHVAFVADLTTKDTEGEPDYAVTPNGRFFVLNVHSELTNDDTVGVPQVFEYDAESEGMTRVSIGDNGYNNNGNGYEAKIAFKEEGEEVFNPSAYFNHLSVTANGSYVFFQSGGALTPGALNQVVVGTASNGVIEKPQYAQNIYEYHAGHVYLISDGQDISAHVGVSQVHLLTTDLSGRDVFFETTDELVGQDTDTNKDIYDARVDGGFPAPVTPPGCEGDACQGSLNGAPVLLSPGSEFQAGGNPPLATAAPAVVKAKPKAVKQAKKKSKAKSKKRVRRAKRAVAGKRSTRRRK